MKKTVIVVAGGLGTRMQSSVPKQFISLAGKPVLLHTLEVFRKYDPKIRLVVVLPESYIDYWKGYCNTHGYDSGDAWVPGGRERFFSIKNALEICGEDDVIAVHDGVRPFVSEKVIAEVFKVAEECGTAIPVIPVTETLRVFDSGGDSKMVDRSLYRIVQTPQAFQRDIIINAYRNDFQLGFTDDASVVEHSGISVTLVDGNDANIKITTPAHLQYAEVLLNR